MGFYLNDMELGLLAGLPYLHIAFYLTLRKCMDFETGKVGFKYPVSWTSLLKHLFIHPIPGLMCQDFSGQNINKYCDD